MSSRIRAISSFILLILFASFSTLTAAQDSDFIRAKKRLDQIESGLAYLKPGDIATYNDLHAKAVEARGLLESTGSKKHPDYRSLTDRWDAIRAQLVEIRELWQNSSVAGGTADKPHPLAVLSNDVSAFAQKINGLSDRDLLHPSVYDRYMATIQGFDERLKVFAGDPNYGLVENNINQARNVFVHAKARVMSQSIFGKYQPENRLDLRAEANAEQAADWATHMASLAGDQMVADESALAAAVAAGNVDQSEQVRFNTWVKGTWHEQILRQIETATRMLDEPIARAMTLGETIVDIDDSDVNKVSAYSGEARYRVNYDTLQEGLQALDVATAFDRAARRSDGPDRSAQRATLEAAVTRHEELHQLAARNAVAARAQAAGAPKKKKKSNSQVLWLRGSRVAEITESGQVWINSRKVGDIESNGKIWVGGLIRGEIEKDGDVWHSGSKVGQLTDKREVWVGGRKVGLIEEDGDVWVGSTQGSLTGEGDWRRAAIVYYFDFF